MIFDDIDYYAGLSWDSVTIPTEYVSPGMWNLVLDDTERDDQLDLHSWEDTYVKFYKIRNSYSIKSTQTYKELRVCRILEKWESNDDDGNPSVRCKTEVHRYVWNSSKVTPSDIEAEEESLRGHDAYRAVERKFNEYRHTKRQHLTDLFSGREYASRYTDIKKCVPVQIQYLCEDYIGKMLTRGVYKADVSSAFPTQMMKDLPTLHGSQELRGRIEPNEEYPFAFYTKSRHIKTLDGYDTKALKSQYFLDYYKCDDSIRDREETTILCKKMDKEDQEALSKAFRDLYDHRKEVTDNKFIMNAAIGYFHRNTCPALSFIAAIVILRCNIDMIRRCRQLEKEGNEILFIATDSIAWRGKLSPVAIDEKYLGSFTYELKDGKFLGYSSKKYQWEDNAGKCTTKCSGLKRSETAKLRFGELQNVSGVTEPRKKYSYDEETSRFCEVPIDL